VEGETQLGIHLTWQGGHHVLRKSELQIALVRDRIELPARPAHQDVGSGDAGSASEIEADERDSTGSGREAAIEHLCPRGSRAAEQRRQARYGHHGGACNEPLGEEVPPRDGLLVALVLEACVGFLALHDEITPIGF